MRRAFLGADLSPRGPRVQNFFASDQLNALGLRVYQHYLCVFLSFLVLSQLAAVIDERTVV